MEKQSKSHNKYYRKRSRSPSDNYRKRKRESYSHDVHRKHDKYSHSKDKLHHSHLSNKYEKPINETATGSKFSFLDYKYELNKVIASCEKDAIMYDLDDFWLFVRKYETIKKKADNTLSHCTKRNCENKIGIPVEFSKFNYMNIKLRNNFDQLYSRLPIYDNEYDEKPKLSESQFSNFIDVLLLYLDFKQREKFNKLKKLRETQNNLPVAQYREEIIETIKSERVVIIAGDTGCGKSTQVPQYLLKAGYTNIACTQPRRIACISLAKRVAFENLSEYRSDIGYQIRFEKNKNKNTKIVFITEGLLLRQASSESALLDYDVIVLDEVHERHLHGDFLLGVMKCLLYQRPELKVVLMSATINIQLFSEYFSLENVKVIQVPGRLYPIQLHYRPIVREEKCSKSSRLNPGPYVQILQIIDEKYPKNEKGDVLIFLSGMSEITTVVDAAKEYSEQSQGWIILPLHSSLSLAEQDKVFDYPPEGVRKCIVSTNIAETSVTIDGIRFVVDSGKVKEMSYDPMYRMQRLKEFWISRASAEQRKGRAGRTGPGVCYRLYSEQEYQDLESYSTPELQRVPLDSLLLQMIAMGLPDARRFPFIEPPASESIENSILSLKHHGALTEEEKLTSIGYTLSCLPVDIVLGKMLVMGSVFHQIEPVLSLAAALSVQTPFTNKAYRDLDCQAARKSFESDHGDPITLLNAFKEWLEVKQEISDKSASSRQWCRRRGLEEQRFYEMVKLHSQFKELLQDCSLVEPPPPESLSSAERSIRHGELRHLREKKNLYKQTAPRRRKELKMEIYNWGDRDEKELDNEIDIKDVEFRMSHDNTKVQNLLSSASACSYTELMMLKIILCSGLYPQFAIADEYNYCKSSNEQLFHTSSKCYVALHPLSFFGNHPEILQLQDPEIEVPPVGYFSKRPLSSKHQMLCYLSLLETTKPYLVNTLRMPTAQTLLLFSHTIETNSSFTQILCDSWILLDFPVPETGQILLMKASKLRIQWEEILLQRLQNANHLCKNDIQNNENKQKSTLKTEYNLSQELISYMRTEICYTVNRILQADLKTIYVGAHKNVDNIEPNPFAEEFKCVPYKKGGVQLSHNIFYNCIVESDWSVNITMELSQIPWTCQNCSIEYCFSSIEKLQHLTICKKNEEKIMYSQDLHTGTMKSNSKSYECSICKQTFYFTPVEILKHKKFHSVKSDT